MQEVVVPVILGALAGGASSLVAPWAAWGVEKKRELIEHRRSQLAEWRQGIAEFVRDIETGYTASGDSDETPILLPLEARSWFYSLSPHIDHRQLNNTFWTDPKSGETRHQPSFNEEKPSRLNDAVAKIEEAWGLR